MKKTYLLAVTLLLLFTTATSQTDSFKALFKLAGGTWKMKTANGYTCEQWKNLGDTVLSGRGFNVVGTDTTIEEQVMLVKRGINIFYIPTVNGQNNGQPVAFKLTSVFNDTYTFSNPSHDYPQIIVYQLASKNILNAWIDGNYNGQQKRIDYHYKRVMN
jgi:hypothetical protein